MAKAQRVAYMAANGERAVAERAARRKAAERTTREAAEADAERDAIFKV